MSAPIARAAAQAGKSAAKSAEGNVLNKGAKRDPELYVCSDAPTLSLSTNRSEDLKYLVINSIADTLPFVQVLLAVMSGAFGLAGFYFGRKPTSSTSETKVSVAAGSMPWQVESSKGDEAREHFKYQ
jgi:hypothetical protein